MEARTHILKHLYPFAGTSLGQLETSSSSWPFLQVSWRTKMHSLCPCSIVWITTTNWWGGHCEMYSFAVIEIHFSPKHNTKPMQLLASNVYQHIILHATSNGCYIICWTGHFFRQSVTQSLFLSRFTTISPSKQFSSSKWKSNTSLTFYLKSRLTSSVAHIISMICVYWVPD